MSVYYVNCSGDSGMSEKEFDSFKEAHRHYQQCKKEEGWNHIEITKQMKVYLPETGEEFV